MVGGMLKDPVKRKLFGAGTRLARLPKAEGRGLVDHPFPVTLTSEGKADRADFTREYERAKEAEHRSTDPRGSVEWKKARVKLAELHGIQRRVNLAHVMDYVEEYAKAERVDRPYIVALKSGLYIFNGHHRLTALWALNKPVADVLVRRLVPRGASGRLTDDGHPEEDQAR